MADDGSAPSTSIWPMPKFQFEVKLGSDEAAFQEVNGLDMESEPIEYRAGNAKAFTKIKMPGLLKYSNITMKKGTFKSDSKLYDWFKKIKGATIERQALTISLLDQEGEAVVTWKVENAFPIKLQGTDLKAEGNEVAVETIEIAHEGLTMEYA